MGEDELQHNLLLGALPPAEMEKLRPRVEVVELELRQSVYRPRRVIEGVYFPLSCVLSMVAETEEHAVIEVATVGFEGMVGLPLFLGSPTSPNSAFCQVPGRAARIEAAELGEFLAQDGDLHRMLRRYTQTIMVQMAQNVACNMTHIAEQRAARWLLTTADRVRDNTFPLTQEFLAQMLGVRRTTVSEIASKLQAEQLIRYSRGTMHIVDRAGLEQVTCGCYRTVRDEFDRLARESTGDGDTGSGAREAWEGESA